MNRPVHWYESVRTLFEAALELPSEQRGLFLRARCTDEGVMREVQSLLEHDAVVDENYLVFSSLQCWLNGADFANNEPGSSSATVHRADERPPPGESGGARESASADPRAPWRDRLPGRQVGAYTIRQFIAEGGMGAVYLAEQLNPRREVALKIMTAAFGSRSAQRRFEFETEALARLQHPHIAQVFEAGTFTQDTGAAVPFFAMEYIRGARPINAYCDDRRLDLAARLRLFCDVCDAVNHGHQRSVIHRDLKPANILVDESGRAKVIDFGVARSTESDVVAATMHTATGQIIGTLAYMSPEQCAADPRQIDTRTDVYSLGVVLFQLLTARLPYDVSGLSIQSAARVICEQQPIPPGTLNRELRGSVEAILLRAIAKNPEHRYASASALRDEIVRFLHGEPISARPPTAYSRVLRWAARHPYLTTGGVCCIIVLTSLLATLVSVRYLQNKPHSVRLTSQGESGDAIAGGRLVRQGDWVQLLSMSNNVLMEWGEKTQPHCIRLAALQDRPARWGGGRVVVIGFRTYPNAQHPGRLCVFDADHANDPPIWHRRVEQSHIDAMPPDAWPGRRFDPGRTYDECGFSIQAGWIMDVFPGDDHPGDEIVAYFQYSHVSQGVLRIYNLNGELLFQAWQDGGISDAYWLPESRRLILIAIKGDKDDWEYGQRILTNHLQLVFAIEPKPGEITQRWINPHPPDWSAAADWYEPAWCALLCPPTYQIGDTANRFNMRLFPPDWAGAASQSDEYVQLDVHAPELLIGDIRSPFSFGLRLNSNGHVAARLPLGHTVRGVLVKSGDMPDPNSFDFVLWPPAETSLPCRSESTQIESHSHTGS